MQQRAVAPAQTDHGLVDGLVAVRVQPHGGADDVGGLGPASREKAHFIHSVEELPVRGLEAVDLRNGAGDNDGHSVGHEIPLQGVANALLGQLAAQPFYVGVDSVFSGFFAFFLCHSCHQLRNIG